MKDLIEIALMSWYITIPLFIFLILLIFFIVIYIIELLLRCVDYLINRRNLKKIEITISAKDNIPDKLLSTEVSEYLVMDNRSTFEEDFDKAVFKKIFKIS